MIKYRVTVQNISLRQKLRMQRERMNARICGPLF